MKTIDLGHLYEVDIYDMEDDSQQPQPLIQFMKREGPGYPGNNNSYPGTNCQEVIRVLIDRMQYLQGQVYSEHNIIVIQMLRICLWQFELRAAERHGWDFEYGLGEIEKAHACTVCGHIVCRGHETGSR